MNDLQVSYFMTGKNISFKKEMTIEQAVEKLLASNYIGGPVVDEVGRVVGWLSEQDCLAKMIEASYYCELAALVEDIMNSKCLTVKADLSIVDLAQQMLKATPKIYPVVDDDNRFVGLITRKGILAAMNKQLETC
ncbi:MAG: CBS domain-containing protein [Psychromonas sp.]|nr:CBS domain-containing protein [Psychromonas sp.]